MALVYRRETDYLASRMNQLRDNLDAYRNRSMSKRRGLAVGILVVLLLPVLVVAFMIARFDPNQYAPAIIAAVDHATGRQLTFGGPITVKLSLTPTIEADNISLSNPPGFADPDLLTLRKVEAKIDLVALFSHRLNIIKLVLVNPDIILEPSKTGAADWNFSAQPPASPASGRAVPAATPGPGKISGYKVALQAVEIANGLLTIKPAGTAAPITIALPQLTGTADSLAAPLHLTANAVLGTTPFDISGVVGPIARLSEVGTGRWPVNLAIQLGSASATVQGAIAHPGRARGYDVMINAKIPALESLTGILPAGLLRGLMLPPVHGIDAAARIVDQNSTIPAIDDLSIKAGASDLSRLRPGLMLSTLDIEMASLDQLISINATGTSGNIPLTLSGHFGAPQALLNPALLPSSMPPQGSFPVALAAQAGDAKFGMTGAIATPQTLAGVALALNAAIPDLSALSPLAGLSLPAWKNINAQTAVIDPGGLGLRNAVGLDGLTVTMDNAAFGGAANLYFGPQPRLQAALRFSQVNVDALRAAMPPPSAPAGSQPAPAPPTTSVNSTTPLPLKLLKTASADLQVSADTLIWNQATFSALQAHGVLSGGIFTLSPVTAQLPGGAVTASATMDATKEPAAESVKLNAPALALAPFLKAFGLPGTAQGTVQAQISATGSGDSLHAIAASLDGQLGLAMVNGVVDGSVLNQLLGSVVRTVGLPAALVGEQGPVAVRCAALRVDASNGIGTIRALTLDSSRLVLQGGGSVDFGDQKLGIILRPQMRVAGTNVSLPVEVGGSFNAPTTSIAPSNAVQAASKSAAGLSGGVAQQVLGGNSFLGKAASLLGIGNASGDGDVCPAALSLGRLGQPGPTAPPMTTAPAAGAATPGASGPKSLLNGLLGQ
jgi:uncharacterized protein involved in outer membrane biogenesis